MCTIRCSNDGSSGNVCTCTAVVLETYCAGRSRAVQCYYWYIDRGTSSARVQQQCDAIREYNWTMIRATGTMDTVPVHVPVGKFYY